MYFECVVTNYKIVVELMEGFFRVLEIKFTLKQKAVITKLLTSAETIRLTMGVAEIAGVSMSFSSSLN